MSDFLRYVLKFFLLLAAIGLVLSVISHVAGRLGLQGPLGEYSWFLHVGIFAVWLPTVLVSTRLTAGVDRKDAWKAALRGCPRWMQLMASGLFGYAFLNFALFIATGTSKTSGKSAGAMPPSVVAGFSGHWMAFYSMAFAVLYSAVHVKDWYEPRRCANGHKVDPLALFCKLCGVAVDQTSP